MSRAIRKGRPKKKRHHAKPFQYKGNRIDPYFAQLNFIQQQAHNTQVNELIKQLNKTQEFARKARDEAISEIYANSGPMDIDPPTRARTIPEVTMVDASTAGPPSRSGSVQSESRREPEVRPSEPMNVDVVQVVVQAPTAVADRILREAGTSRDVVMREAVARVPGSQPPLPTPQQMAAARMMRVNARRLPSLNTLGETLTLEIDNPRYTLTPTRREGQALAQTIGANKSPRFNTGEFNELFRAYGSSEDGMTTPLQGERERTAMRQRLN